jgi:hypothetical protein
MILTIAGLILAAILSFTSYQKLETTNPLKQKFLQVSIALFVTFGALILLMILLAFSPLTFMALSKGSMGGMVATGFLGILAVLLVLVVIIALIVAIVFAWQTYLAALNTEYNVTALITALAITLGILFFGFSLNIPTNLSLNLNNV